MQKIFENIMEKNNGFILLDGAMGTMLQAEGLKVGEIPETWNITNPDKVISVQKKYVEAGSNIIYANTFGANRHKLSRCAYSPAEIITAGIKAARKAAEGTGTLVALDIGPIGQMLEPLGPMKFDEAYDIYLEMLSAGEAAGADLVIFETMSDLYELKAGVLAAKEHTSLPVWTTMTFEASGRTFIGATVPAMALTLTGLGVDAMGFNCSLGPDELISMSEELSRWTDVPMILKPNAGLPDPATGLYNVTPAQFAEGMVKGAELGIRIFGGCCGTTPEFIASVKFALQEKYSSVRPPVKQKAFMNGVCSSTEVAVLDGGVRVIGERINPTGKKRFQQALRENDIDYIVARGLEEEDAGADILDVNVGLPGIDEPRMMVDVVKSLQSVTGLPLQLDSSDAAALEAGLRSYNGKPIVNSVNGNADVLDKILPLCRKYGAAVVGLCMDKRGIPQSAEERIEIGERIIAAAESYGIPREDVYLDCLTLTVSAQQDQALETLKAVRYFAKERGQHTVLGVSNISFGLPARENITINFLTQAMCQGLDLPIINPNQLAVMDAVASFRVLSGEDKDSTAYIERFANRQPPVQAAAPAAPNAAAPAGSSGARGGAGISSGALGSTGAPGGPQGGSAAAGTQGAPGGNGAAGQAAAFSAQGGALSIEAAVGRGLKKETAELTRKALESFDEMTVINTMLIPALDIVGERYEKQQIFLPQLINAANAACEGFEIIKQRIAEKGSGSISKGKIVIATVEGDIHDIGKNIVKVVLENYGYTIVDLGRDVPVDEIVQAVIREDVRLVGLSALMTTTVANMKRTIEALRASGHDCKIWVGGAVLTPEYAKEIGADFYARDAKQSVDIAKKVFG